MKRLITTALLVGISMSTYAQGVLLQGFGRSSCGEYLEFRAKQSPIQDAIIVSWVWGYMSGFNMESKYPTTANYLPDQASTLAYIDKHCRESPLDDVLIATGALIKALGGRRNPR